MSLDSFKNYLKLNNIIADDLKSFVTTKVYSNPSFVLIGLKKVLSFFKECETYLNEKSGNYQILLSYFNTEIPCQEIFELWIYFYQHNNFSIISIILEIMISVIRIVGLLGIYTSGNKIIKRILNFHIKSIYRSLNSDVDLLVVRGMKLLIEMLHFNSGSLMLEIFNSFDFSHKVVFKILRSFSKASNSVIFQINRQFSTFETPRIFMIRFILCFLRLGSVSLKSELLSYKNIFYDIFSGLIRDNTDFIREVLDIITRYVIFEKGIPRSIKLPLFNDYVLNKLVMLYSGADGEVSRSIIIHNFLVFLCTRPGMGVCFESNGWYPKSGTDLKKNEDPLIYNKILSVFIFKLKITQDVLQQELFLKICQACPELIAHCASQFSINIRFDPHLTVSWLSISSIYQSIILLPIPPMTIFDISLELVLNSILENILPLALTKVSLTLGLRHNNDLVVFFTVNLVLSSINKYSLIIAMLDKNNLDVFIFERKRLRQLLKEMFLERLPDIHIVFFLFKTIWEKSNSLLKFSIVKLFSYYIEFFPEIVFLQKHNYSSILIKGFSGMSKNVYSSLIFYYLFRIFHKFLPILDWWNKKQEYLDSIFTTLVKFYLFCENEEFKKEYKDLISCLLVSSNAFSSVSFMDSGELILKSLDDVKCFSNDVDIVVDFLGNSLMHFMNSPHKYMDDFIAFIFDYKLEINQRFPGLIIIVLLEQWGYFFFHSMSSNDDKILIASWLSRIIGFFALNEDIWEISKKICFRLVNLTQKYSIEIAQIFNRTKMYIGFLDDLLFLDKIFFENPVFFLTIKGCQNISFTNYRYSCDLLNDSFVLIDFILHGEILQLSMYFDDILYYIQSRYIRVSLLDVIALKKVIYLLLRDDKKATCEFNDILLKYFKIIKSIGNVLKDTKDFEKFRKIIIEGSNWKDNYLNFKCKINSFKIKTFSKEFVHLIVEFIDPLSSYLLLEIIDKTYAGFISVLTDKLIRAISLSSNEWNEVLLLLKPYWPENQFSVISVEILEKYIQEIYVFGSVDSDVFGFFELIFNYFFTINFIEIVEFSDLISIFNMGLRNGYYLNIILKLLTSRVSSLANNVAYDFCAFIDNGFFLTLQNINDVFSLDLINKLCAKSIVFFEMMCGNLCEIVEKCKNTFNLPSFFLTNLLCIIDAYVLWKNHILENKNYAMIKMLESRLIYLLQYVEDDLLKGFFNENDEGVLLFQILFKSIKINLFEDGKKILNKFCTRCDKMILNRRFVQVIELMTYIYGNELIDNYIKIWFINVTKLLIECFSEERLSSSFIDFLESFIDYLTFSKKRLSNYVLENFYLLIEIGLKNHILVYNVVRFISVIVKGFNMDDSTLFVLLILSRSDDWKDINNNVSISFEHRLIIVQLLHYFTCNSSNFASLSIVENICSIYTGTTHIIDRVLLYILQKNEESFRHNFFNKKIVFNVESNIKKNLPLKFFYSEADLTITLSSELLTRSIYFFPLEELSLDFFEMSKDKVILYCNKVEIVYDPLFFLPLIMAYINLEEQLSFMFLIDSGILGYILISLSSYDMKVRKMSLAVLSVLKNSISTIHFSEKSQILMFFQVLKSSISISSIELGPISYVVSLFMALSIQIITNPSHFLFDEVCRFYLQRPKLDFQDVPMFYIFWSGSCNYYKQSNWLISFLNFGLRTLMDYKIYKKRHIFELLCCLFSSELATSEIRFRIINLFSSALDIYQVNLSLVRDYGIVSWVEQQIVICNDKTLKSMLMRLFLRLHNLNLKTVYKYKKM
ncbi:uncharacterized protein T551_00594 [Pneumocystis jirovecii RU7]|uniref:Nucleolar pre-ribosomal-associated protein 1 C-terminal domain-containing protein n=1 Tax=Pneumocystis jirovecii (strain RU7) TaxID=1408657 RepID=A0A0W4ZVV4_PNEJ7|nr:uncharacterized protein T551_00594 [Pneumocystis jirovecii RU7]KTW32504.1 hypothetical protein T551_00594 [Pneumocystis jirovecii RU7]